MKRTDSTVRAVEPVPATQRSLRKETSSSDLLVEDIRDQSELRKVRKATVVFHQCDGAFWERTRNQINGGNAFEVIDSHLDNLEMGKKYVIVLGFKDKKPSQDEISEMIQSIRQANALFGQNAKVLCVIPRNGELQKSLLDNGASDVINTKEVDIRWVKVIGEHIQHLLNDFDGTEQLNTAIVCRGSDDPDQKAKLARSIETMDRFAGETIVQENGEKKVIRKYIYHMKITGHEDARNSAMSQLRGSIGKRVIVPGCGEGHQVRVTIRNILMPEIEAGHRQPTFIIGIDRLEKMIKWWEEGYKALKRQSRRDCKKGKSSMVAVPNFIDLAHIHRDMYDVGRDDVSDIRMGGRSRIPFGVADTIILEYIAQWQPEKMDLVKWAYDMLCPGGKVLLLEEYPLKVSPSIFMTKADATDIDQNTWRFKSGVEEYYTLWENNGFIRAYNRVQPSRIDPANVPDEDAHHVYGMVMVKKPGSRIFIPKIGNDIRSPSDTESAVTNAGEGSGGENNADTSMGGAP